MKLSVKQIRKGFTLVELIFVIVIIGILSAVAIPKFSNLSDNSKIASELATASSVQTALDAIHSEWITNTCDFDWGNAQNTASNPLNSSGYPDSLGNPLDHILKNTENSGWTASACGTNTCYRGPATNGGAKNRDLPGKPEGNDYWEYNPSLGTFKLIEP